ncbi:50S ribosome-binding GTPase [Candidatus Woesearchaeota archaeon]|nr:50S ribosome-binding GTPase [Candidatus Woesearchaeota archaeon]
MNLQGLGKVETYQTYLDMAFKNGIAQAVRIREDTTNPNKLYRSKKIETLRIETMGKSLMSNLDMLNRSFPMFDELDPFYQELVRCTLDYDMLKKSLGSLMWAKQQIFTIMTKQLQTLRGTRELGQVNKVRKAFSGRISSVMKQIKENFEYLEVARKVLKGYPSLKTSVDTIVLAGMPNVGKSTLLAILTGSKPQVASYPFTTKRINLGYDSEGKQFVDTPGLLDRPLSDRNPIEKQAVLALKYVAKIIVFVIDPTETCGYTVPQQESLLKEIKRLFDLPIILVANKADTGADFKGALMISAKEGIGIDKLRKDIDSLLAKISKESS